MGSAQDGATFRSFRERSVRRFFARIRRLLNTPAGISVGRMGTQSLSLVTAPIIAQSIGPSGRGLTAAAVSAITITGIVIGLGVPLAVRRRAVLSEGRADVIRTARGFAWMTVLPALLLGVILSLTLLRSLDPMSQLAFLTSMACAGLTVSWIIDTQVLVADQRYFRILWLGSIQTVAYFLLIMVLWIAGAMSVAAVIWAYTAGTIAAFLLGRWWVRAPGGRFRGLRSLFREGFRVWGSQAAEVASARLDQLLVLPIIGAAPAGLYSVAATIGALPVSIGIGMGAATFRGFVQDRAAARVVAAIRMAVALAVILAATVAVASIWGIPLLFGADFAGSVPLAFVTLAGGVAVVGSYIGSMALVAHERGLQMTLVQMVGLIVGIGLLIPAGSLWGAMGAAAASTLGYFATFAGALIVLRISPWQAIPRLRDFRRGLAVFFGRR